MTRRGLFRLLRGAAAVPVAAVAAVLPYPKGTWVPRSGSELVATLEPLPHFKYIELRSVENWREVVRLAAEGSRIAADSALWK